MDELVVGSLRSDDFYCDDHGWQEVAETVLDFVERFVPAKPS